MSLVPLMKAKTRAALLHVSLSAIIFVPLAWMIAFRWFPGPLFFTDGGWQGVRIMLLVDMVLGTALTFMIYNPAKTRLALSVDFGFIGVVQAAALAYGAWNIESTHIWSIAFNPMFDSFMAVGKEQMAKQHIPEGGWARLGDKPQYWVFVREPKPAEMPAVLDLGARGIPLEAVYDLYEPLAQYKQQVFSKSLNMSVLIQRDAAFAGKYQEFLQSQGASAGNLHFYRLAGSYRSVVIALDGEARYVGFINADVPRG